MIGRPLGWAVPGLDAYAGTRTERAIRAVLEDPRGYVLSIVNMTYVWADNVLYGDELARRVGVP